MSSCYNVGQFTRVQKGDYFDQTDNKLQKLTKDPTLKFQESVKSVLKSCTNIINKYNKYRYIQIKPLAPKLNTTIKLHKDGAPIRPVVNYRHTPAYNIAKFASHWLKTNYDLPYTYNIQNSKQFANQIKNLNIHDGHKMMTLDISNLYTNIPVKEVIQIIEKELGNNSNLNSSVKTEIIRLIKTTTEQNYFMFNDNFWKQETGTPMGSPISSIIAEIVLQNLENEFYPSFKRYNIPYVTRYVDDISSSMTAIQPIHKPLMKSSTTYVRPYNINTTWRK
jgi:hypothetical protein